MWIVITINPVFSVNLLLFIHFFFSYNGRVFPTYSTRSFSVKVICDFRSVRFEEQSIASRWQPDGK